MATALHVGARGDQTILVTDDLTAAAMGSGSLPVLATPAMIALMEAAAVAAIDQLLPEGQASVGIEINVRHLSATPVNEEIIASAIVTQIDGKRVTFEVRAWDRKELIGEGTHVRYIIDEVRFMSRLGDSED
jgi:fluoroacetyl-CoA thioesterase